MEKAREALAREMGQRAEEQKRKDSAVESTLQNLFMNVSQEKQQREDECGRLQQALYDEAAVRHAENTQLAEVVDRVRLARIFVVVCFVSYFEARKSRSV